MDVTGTVDAARSAFARQAWRESCRAFATAAEDGPLEPADWERFAVSAYLIGDDDLCSRGWEAAHLAAREDGDSAAAARCAVLLALCLVLRGQMARAGGWLARAEGLVAEVGGGCAASGYVLVPRLLAALHADPSAARDLAVRAEQLGRRFRDPDLRALGVLGAGQAALALGDVEAGLARLDEVMVSVSAGEVGPVVAGIVYCAVILECLRLHDVARAAEWTGALGDWCEAQPDLVPYRGQCLVHRSQLQQIAGRWSDAVSTAEAACRHLADPPHPALGLAYYQEAELHRLRGELARAEAGYADASRHGHDPTPGVALLELARGEVAAAEATIGRALAERNATQDRPALLAAAVDIRCAAGDIEGARAAAGELAALAGRAPSTVLRAMAAHAEGSLLATEGDMVAALAELRPAARAWQALHMPYEAARTAVVIGQACGALGDRVAATLEFDNARAAFAALGARPDLERLDRLAGRPGDGDGAPARRGRAAGLSAREREVLGEIVAGKTNREIAEALAISQHTVGRHVESIFTKLGVTSRAAATAQAYEHGLLSGPHRSALGRSPHRRTGAD